MEWLLRDVRYAWVTLRRTPELTLTVLVTLALGVHATTAVFSVVHACCSNRCRTPIRRSSFGWMGGTLRRRCAICESLED